MIRRPIKVPVSGTGPAQRLARQKSDFTAEGAPAPAPDAAAAAAPSPSPPAARRPAGLPHGPPRRKRW